MAKHILIVDDEPLVSKTLVKLLQKQGFIAEVAESGEDALDVIKKDDFDLIITDVRMPGMDGVEMIKKIREYRKHAGKPAVPEIMITGYADIDKYEAAMKLKVKEYMYKPFDNRKFLDIVHKILD
ncbi:MAG: response regulator [Candidatus Omnitrophota bacterium]|jgi:DNA-binding NtrC family response regulator